MFEINYIFSRNSDINVVTANETALRYHIFLGSLSLRKGNKLIVMDWDWIPLLDFAICILSISKNLLEKTQGIEEFEFTESDGKIRFKKDENNLKIIPSFSVEILEMSFEEFQNTVNKFYKEIFQEVIKKNINIKSNDSFKIYLQDFEKL